MLQDSIEYYIGKSFSSSDLEEIKIYINKVDSFNNLIINDSLCLANSLKASFQFFNYDLNDEFKLRNDNILRKSNNLKDSINTARALRNLGDYHFKENNFDSAFFYYKSAQRIYLGKRDSLNVGRLFNNISELNYKIRNYSQAEKSVVLAIKHFKQSHDTFDVWKSYTILSLIYINQKEYFKAEDFLLKALNLSKSKELEAYMSYETTLSNLAYFHIEQKNYKKALNFIELGLQNSNIFKEYPELYSSLLNFRAKIFIHESLFDLALTDLITSLKIREELNINFKIVDSYINFAQYHKKQGNINESLRYLILALDESTKCKTIEVKVTVLQKLSELNEESFKNYAQEYITLNDSLINLERKNAEKFARIEFEADELEREKGELLQKNKTLWRWGSTSAVFLGLVFVIYFQRNRHRHLKNKQKQEELNLSVYRLMLSRQEELERVRQEEKNRIAEELHDNIMNKMAAVRFNLTPLEFEPDPETIRKTLPYIHSIQDIEKEIRKLSHDLHREVFQSQQDYRALLEQLFNEYQNQKVRLFVEINKEVRWDRFSADQKMHLYRLLQEGISNVMKHAGATQLKIHLHLLEKDLFEMELEDNGKGMGPLTQEGLGLKTMKKRVDAMGGKLHFSMVEPKGTLLQIHIPLQRMKKERINFK